MQCSRQESFTERTGRGCWYLGMRDTAVGEMEGIVEVWGREVGKVFLRLKLFLMLNEHSFKILEG